MHALIIGASGATGTSLVRLLGNDGCYRKITAFTRRPMPAPAGTEGKWVNHVVDFRQPATWAHLVQGDAAFSCLGTTLKTAGSQSAQFEIDHDYQLSFAQAAARNGVGTLVLVSATQANADSRFFYMRMKGQLENAVRALPFAKTVILRPPMLVRDHSDRPSEILTVKLLRGLNAIGLFRSQKPMPTDTLARAMCQAAAEFPEGVHILEAADIWQAAS